MKKFIVTILAFLYLATSSGTVIHLHYCMGKLIGMGLLDKDANATTCSNCGMKKVDHNNKNCCKDEHKLIKIEKDQKTTEAAYQMMQLYSGAVPSAFSGLPVILTSSLTKANPLSNAPPRANEVAVYLRNCVFRI